MTGNGAVGNESTLALLNDSLHPGLFTTQQEDQVSAVAFDPTLDLVYVSANFPLVGNISQDFIAVVNPATHVVVGTIGTPGCASWSDTGLVYDPNTGLLYDSCSSGNWALAIDPVSGSIVANVSLGGYGIGPDCAGFTPDGLALAVAPQLNDIFALVADCQSPTNASEQSAWALTLSVLDDRTDAILRSISLGPSATELPSAYWWAEPMAFDTATGQLYVSVVLPNPTTAGGTVSIVDPVSGDVVSTMHLPVEAPSYDLPDLLFSEGAGAVLTSGIYLPTTGPYVTAVFRLDPLTDQTNPIIVLGGWKNCSAPAVLCGPYVSPTYLTAGPGIGPNVTVSARDLVGDNYGLVYNMSDGAEVANLSLGPAGFGAYDAIDHAMFFPDAANERLDTMVGSPVKVGTQVPLGVVAYSETVDPATGTLYVAAGSPCGTILLEGACANETIDVVPLAAERSVESWPVTAGIAAAVLFDPLNQRIYVLSECSSWNQTGLSCLPGHGYSAITAYSTSGRWLAESVLSNRFFAWVPQAMTIDSATGAVLVTTVGSSRTSVVIDIVNPLTAAVEGNVTLACSEVSLGSVTYDPRDNLVFAYDACGYDQTKTHQCLWAFNGSTYAPVWNTTFPVYDETMEGLTFDSLNDTLLVANNDTVLTVSPRNGTVLAEQLETGTVQLLSYDPGNNVLYVTSGSNLVEENASTGAPLRVLPLTGAPSVFFSSLVVDPASGLAAVAQPFLGSLVLASGVGPEAYPVQFTETGLPASTPWTVSVGGTTQTVSGPIAFFVPNGTYSYSIGSVPGFEQTTVPSAGTITVDGSGLIEPTAAYGLVTYSITFSETGAADPSGWNVTLLQETGYPNEAPCVSCLNSASARSFAGANGTYRYLLEGLGTGYQLSGIAPSGTFSVDGAPVTLDFGFVPGHTPNITFRAKGLSVNLLWCVLLASIEVRCTTGSSLRFGNLTPATYAYAILPPSGFAVAPGSGRIALANASVSLTGKFAPRDYLVTLVEVGLAAHTRWKVEIDGKTVSGSRPFLTTELPNGTYSYSALPIRGYTGAWSGKVTVNGSATAVDGTFVPVFYAVTFSEVGLPNGTNWSVTIRGITYHSVNSTLIINLGNGTYSYKIGAISGYTRSSTPSRIKVDGGPAAATVTFRAK